MNKAERTFILIFFENNLMLSVSHFTMLIFSFEAAYTQSDYPVEVKLRQYLFFQASVKTKDKTLSVLVENCYATPSQDRQHDDKYHLIKEG